MLWRVGSLPPRELHILAWLLQTIWQEPRLKWAEALMAKQLSITMKQINVLRNFILVVKRKCFVLRKGWFIVYKIFEKIILNHYFLLLLVLYWFFAGLKYFGFFLFWILIQFLWRVKFISWFDCFILILSSYRQINLLIFLHKFLAESEGREVGSSVLWRPVDPSRWQIPTGMVI